MKNFDLNSMGVHEMKAFEMKETDGGFWWVLELVCAYVIVEACCNPEAHIKAFKEGWDLAAAEQN